MFTLRIIDIIEHWIVRMPWIAVVSQAWSNLKLLLWALNHVILTVSDWVWYSESCPEWPLPCTKTAFECITTSHQRPHTLSWEPIFMSGRCVCVWLGYTCYRSNVLCLLILGGWQAQSGADRKQPQPQAPPTQKAAAFSGSVIGNRGERGLNKPFGRCTVP